MSFRILLSAWPMWMSPFAYGGPSCSTNCFAPGRAAFCATSFSKIPAPPSGAGSPAPAAGGSPSWGSRSSGGGRSLCSPRAPWCLGKTRVLAAVGGRDQRSRRARAGVAGARGRPLSLPRHAAAADEDERRAGARARSVRRPRGGAARRRRSSPATGSSTRPAGSSRRRRRSATRARVLDTLRCNMVLGRDAAADPLPRRGDPRDGASTSSSRASARRSPATASPW